MSTEHEYTIFLNNEEVTRLEMPVQAKTPWIIEEAKMAVVRKTGVDYYALQFNVLVDRRCVFFETKKDCLVLKNA